LKSAELNKNCLQWNTIKGLPDINKAYFDVNIESLNPAKDIAGFVPKEPFPIQSSYPLYLS
jgi:hypothetical protein